MDFDLKSSNRATNFRYCAEQLCDALSRTYMGCLVAPGSSHDWKHEPTSKAGYQFDGMMNMLRQIASDKSFLVFNLYNMLDEAAKTGAFYDNIHLNQRGKAIIATADTAISDVMAA